MSDREIRELLRQLNNVPEQRGITCEHISGPVFRAAVVTELERAVEGRGGPRVAPHTFYFVRSSDGRFAGAVHDAVGDLHWYLVRCYRRQGLMSAALRDVILPHIAATGRAVQRITISEGIGQRMFAASQQLATAVGFDLVSEGDADPLEYELNLSALVVRKAPVNRAQL